MKMDIALAQINIQADNNDKNIAKMLEYIKIAAAKAKDVVVFPEMCDTGYVMDILVKTATNWSHGAVPQLQQAAKKYKINVVAGVAERVADKIYNTVVTIDRTGQIHHKYRKTHLITAKPIEEQNYLAAGNRLGITTIDGIKVGIMTCYELRFPEIARTLTLAGVEMIILPAAWPLSRVQHWQTLVTARAIENQLYIAAVCRIGTDAGMIFAGTSMLVDAYGKILLQASAEQEKLLAAKVDFEYNKTVRAQIHVLQDRRVKLYDIMD